MEIKSNSRLGYLKPTSSLTLSVHPVLSNYLPSRLQLVRPQVFFNACLAGNILLVVSGHNCINVKIRRASNTYTYTVYVGA